MSPPRRGSRARARSRAGRPMPRHSPARWRSKRSTASCAAKARRRPLTRARTASLPGCSAARRRNISVPLPEPGEAKRAILDTYTKEHSAEYQSQALIDLARRLGAENRRPVEGRKHRHPHQPPHPLRDRHRRQRSAEDGPEGEPRNARPFHHVHFRGRAGGRRLASRTILRARTRRPRPRRSRCGDKISTVEDPEWTRRYHSHDPEREGVRRPRRRHSSRTARSSATKWPSPMPIRSAPARSSGRTTSGSSGRWRKASIAAGGTGSLHRDGREAGRAEGRRTRPNSPSRSIRSCSASIASHGIFDWRHAAPVAVQRAAGQR